MIYNVILILIIICLRSIVLSQRNGTVRVKMEQRYSTVAWALIVLMAALRKPIVDTDVWGYMREYINMFNTDLLDVLNEERTRDYVGYYFTSKLFSLLGLSYHWWFGFLEAFYSFSLAKLVNRFSNDKLYSILVFVTIGLFGFSLAGLKQVMSMSLMMLAFLCYIDKKFLQSVLFIIYAYFCHPVSLVFFVAFPLYSLRTKNYYITLVVVAAVILLVFSRLFLVLGASSASEHFQMYLEDSGTYTYVAFIFYVVIIAMASLGLNKYLTARRDEGKMVFVFSLLTCVIQLFAGISPNLFRLAFFFSPFMMIYLPNSTQYISGNKSIVRLAIIFSIVFFYLYTLRNSAYPYSFFWQ